MFAEGADSDPNPQILGSSWILLSFMASQERLIDINPKHPEICRGLGCSERFSGLFYMGTCNSCVN